MPRASTYRKNPERYRQKARGYGRKNVPGSIGHNTFGYNNTGSMSGAKGETFEEVRRVLENHYTKRHVSRKLKRMEEQGQVYICDGYAFMPLSSFLKAYGNKEFITLSDSHRKGEEGTLQFIPCIQNCYPITKGFMVYTNPVTERGVDFLVTKDGLPYTVLELTHYGEESFLHSREIKRYVKSLNEWSTRHPDIFKVLVVKHPNNVKINPHWKNAYTEFVKNNIGIKILRK